MARRRRSQVAMRAGKYNPKVATAARFRKKPGPRPATLAREAEKAAQRVRGAELRKRIPKPDPHAREFRWSRYLPDNEEVRTIRRMAVEEERDSYDQSHEWRDELRSIAMDHWRALHAADKKAHPRAKRRIHALWVRVRAYRRHHPRKVG